MKIARMKVLDVNATRGIDATQRVARGTPTRFAAENRELSDCKRF
jgi:hypothetical protein